MNGNNIPNLFGSQVFNETVMREKLPNESYKAIKKTIDEGISLDPTLAQVVANAMKDWAIEKGATHYTHWFQPMTGLSAEKHDAFITPAADGKVIMEFSGKELIKGEPDASSFPSGGLRATFEARGYTAWDATSYAFVKDDTLYIPTAFCSYSGEALDKKTPLLRSMEAVNKQALRVLKFFNNPCTRVTTSVGAEQEYFLVDKSLHEKRKDLFITGRTLFGAKPPKGQELDDHYFGNLKERVSAYMKELDLELWKLGIYAKTKHNEVAPAQHELAPIYCTSNMAADHNQLIMEMMKKVALRHNLVCLLHEKPFAGVNGSGKHNNWSICTNTGENLLKPGKDPQNNKQFLMFLAAIIKAVDLYADLLRVSVATAGNDHRLGANEAPPAIVSMFLGDELAAVLSNIEKGESKKNDRSASLQIGVTSLPVFNRDTTDRNRTSPFAFTGNKFEFRMPGSSQSISGINIVLNTIVAETLSIFATRLEASKNPAQEIDAIIKDTIVEHKRVVFNGNNYAEEWVTEAEKRGLLNLKSCIEALPHFIKEKNVEVFDKHAVLSKVELHSRYEIIIEDYSKCINIEALTMIEVVKKEILPAVLSYSKVIFGSLKLKKESGLSLDVTKEEEGALKFSQLTESLISRVEALENSLMNTKGISDALEQAKSFRDDVFAAMQNVRAVADELETMVGTKYWPMPTYTDLLFRV